MYSEFQVLDGQLLVSLDGTGYFSSKAIHCQNCLYRTTAQGEKTYYHTAITPVIVKPGCSQVISLVPEFIMPQDGQEKQDCERVAAKRWLKQQATLFRPDGATLLGDDLYCNQPLCQVALEQKFNFIFVCKPDSHKILYEWLDFLAANGDIDQLTVHPDFAVAVVVAGHITPSSGANGFHLLRKMGPQRTFYCVKSAIRYLFGLGMSTRLTYAARKLGKWGLHV